MANLMQGNWYGLISGTPSTLTLTPTPEGIAGAVDAGGYPYTLELKGGRNGSAQGILRDGKNGTTVPASLAPQGADLTLTFTLPGQMPTTIPLSRTQAQAGENLDPRLIGQWLNSESHISGNFSTLVEISIAFLADGRALEFEGRVIGDAGDTGPGQNLGQGTTTYYWAADGQQLFFGQAPGQYAPAGTYVVDGNSLLITHLDGNRVYWQRVA